MAIRASVSKAKARKGAKKAGGLKSKAVTRKPRAKMSDDARRKSTRDKVRALRARQRSKGLTYKAGYGWVPYKDKATAARARARAGKKSPLFNKPVKNLAGRLAKRSLTQRGRKPGYNHTGRKRMRPLKIGKRPAIKVRKKRNNSVAKAKAPKKMDGRSKTARQKKQADFWAKFRKN